MKIIYLKKGVAINSDCGYNHFVIINYSSIYKKMYIQLGGFIMKKL